MFFTQSFFENEMPKGKTAVIINGALICWRVIEKFKHISLLKKSADTVSSFHNFHTILLGNYIGYSFVSYLNQTYRFYVRFASQGV